MGLLGRVSQLTDADKLGTLFGLFESIEKLAGIGGPLFGGVLAQVNDNVRTCTASRLAFCVLCRCD